MTSLLKNQFDLQTFVLKVISEFIHAFNKTIKPSEKVQDVFGNQPCRAH